MPQRRIKPIGKSFYPVYGMYCSIRPSFIIFILTVIGLLAASGTDGFARSSLKETDTEESWHITADKIEYDNKLIQYIATGDVVITGKDRKVTADVIRYDKKNHKAYASGNVVMKAGEGVMIGERMELDLEKKTGVAYQGTIFIREGHFRITGDRIERTGEDTYFAENASVTTCDGDNPDWKVTGARAKVTMEGYGVVNHAALWAKKVPVMYSPYLIFPAKRKRQSGLLTPRFAHSKRFGFEYEQPYYWAINENTDSTFYWDRMKERGDKGGIEYRYVIDGASKGTAMFDFLNDYKVDDGTGDTSQRWGYDEDSELRPNSDRYWFRMKHNHALPADFFVRVDLDVVSDQDYLTEFKRGYTGFEETDAYFHEEFGRDLNDYTETIRNNKLTLSKSWDMYSFNAGTRWDDNVVNRRFKDTDDTLQRLPSIELSGSKQETWEDSWLYWGFDSGYNYFFRIDGQQGHRTDIHPRLYVPLRFRNYFSFEPSVGVRETAWYVTDHGSEEENPDDTQHREIYDVKLDLSTEIYRIFNTGWMNIDKIRHAIKPQVIYTFVPEMDQSEYPYFDEVDRLERDNRITYSITNTFTSRTTVKRSQQSRNGDNEEERNYRKLCRFKLEQSYDIDKGNEDHPEPFSAVFGELELYPHRYFTLDAEANWNQYTNRFTRHIVTAGISDDRGDRFLAEHIREEDETESIKFSLIVILTEQFSLYTGLERDLKDKKDIETGISLLYKSGCWSADFGRMETRDDISYSLLISLYGLGGFGSAVRPD